MTLNELMLKDSDSLTASQLHIKEMFEDFYETKRSRKSNKKLLKKMLAEEENQRRRNVKAKKKRRRELRNSKIQEVLEM